MCRPPAVTALLFLWPADVRICRLMRVRKRFSRTTFIKNNILDYTKDFTIDMARRNIGM
jgi:hypothetical protein